MACWELGVGGGSVVIQSSWASKVQSVHTHAAPGFRDSRQEVAAEHSRVSPGRAGTCGWRMVEDTFAAVPSRHYHMCLHSRSFLFSSTSSNVSECTGCCGPSCWRPRYLTGALHARPRYICARPTRWCHRAWGALKADMCRWGGYRAARVQVR